MVWSLLYTKNTFILRDSTKLPAWVIYEITKAVPKVVSVICSLLVYGTVSKTYGCVDSQSISELVISDAMILYNIYLLFI